MDFITLKEILFPTLHIERKNVCVLNLGDFFPPFLILFKLGLPEITYCWKIQWIWWIYKRIYKDTQVCLGIQKKQKFMLDWIIISNYLQFPNSLGIYNSPICLSYTDTILKCQTEFIFSHFMTSVTIWNALNILEKKLVNFTSKKRGLLKIKHYFKISLPRQVSFHDKVNILPVGGKKKLLNKWLQAPIKKQTSLFCSGGWHEFGTTIHVKYFMGSYIWAKMINQVSNNYIFKNTLYAPMPRCCEIVDHKEN